MTMVWVTCPKTDPCPGFLGSQGEAGGLHLYTDLNKSNEVCTSTKQGNGVETDEKPSVGADKATVQ